MDEKLKAILESLGETRLRSRLEPFGEFIDELRRRGRTIRDIARILTDECQIKAPRSTVHDFVVSRMRMQRRSRLSRQRATQGITMPGVNINARGRAHVTNSNLEGSHANKIMERIAALKRRPVATESSAQSFQYDPDQPLCITPKNDK